MAFSFDATDYLTITDHADLTIPVGDWTFCGSFKVPASVRGGSNFPRMYQHGTATSSTPRIIIFYVESAAGYANANHFCAFVDDGSTSIGTVTVNGKNLTDLIGKWVYWCVTYDYSAKTMYVRILDRDNYVYYSKSGSAGSYLGAINPAVDATIAQGPGASSKFVGDMGEVAFIPGIFFDANTWHGYVHGGRPYRYPSNSWQVPMIGNRTTEIIGRGAYNLTMSASGAGVTEAPDSPQASSMFPPHFYNSSDAEEVESAPTTYRPLIISNGKIRQMRNGETLDATIINADEIVVSGFEVPTPTAADQVLYSSGAGIASWISKPDCWVITSTQITQWDTAYSWGDHAGLYDATGTAAAAVASHESTYNHANYDTAYSWGDHAGLYDTLGTAASLVGTHESTYFHNTGPTADNQLLQATGAGTAAWTTDVQTLTSLAVDSLTLDNNVIASSGGVYVFSTSGNLVLRAQTSGSIYIDTASKLWVREEGSYTTRFTVSAVDGSVGIGSDNLSNTGVYMNVWTSGSGIASQFLVTGRAYSSGGAAYSLRVATQAYPANGQQARQVNVEGSVRVDAGNTIPWLIGMMINPIPKSGDGTVTNAASLYVYPQTIGVTNYAIIVTGGVSRFNDSAVLAFGTDSDATITYDGTDLIVNPDAVGSGHLKINGATDIVGGLTVDGVSVSGTIQIGSSDVCRVLSENKTYYVRTTGNDTTGDGSSGTPWLTVGRALDEIYKWVADENTITIDVGEGTFAESTLSPTYAYGSNLYVTGVSETHTSGCAVSSIGSITALESGLEYIDFTITLPSGYTSAVGQYIACKTASGGTNNHLTLGVHEVIGWNSGTRAATVRCVRRAGVTAVPSGAISLTDIRVIKTVLAFASGHGINMVGAYHGGNWDALVLTGNSSGYALNLTNGASIVASSSFATSDWNNTIYCAGNGNFFGDSTCHSFCRGSLIRVQNGGVAQIRYGTVLTGAKTTGIFCFVGATVAAYQVQMATCGNADGVLCYQGGFVDVSSGYVRDGKPTGNGCNANRGGGIDATSATISGYATSTATATNGYIIGP